MHKTHLKSSVDHHIAISSMLIKRVFYKVLSKHELSVTPEQWNILYPLSEEGSFTVSELSQLAFKDFANTSRIIQKLETGGFVKKERDAIDKRVIKILITDVGVDLVKQLHECAFEATNIAINGIDDETREVLLKSLKTVISNAEEYLD